MKKLIYILPLFIMSCADDCVIRSTFFDNNKMQTLKQNIDCDASIGIEKISYNKAGTIIKLEQKYINNDSLARKKYFDNGHIKSLYFEVNQLKTGEHIKYFKNGGIRSVTPYLKGKKHGNHFKWLENGTVKKQSTYRNDSLIQL